MSRSAKSPSEKSRWQSVPRSAPSKWVPGTKPAEPLLSLPAHARRDVRSWVRCILFGKPLFFATQIQQFKSILAIAGELKRDVDAVRREKMQCDAGHVARFRRTQVGNIHERK